MAATDDVEVAFQSRGANVVADWLPTADDTKESDYAVERVPARVGLGAKFLAHSKVCVCVRGLCGLWGT